MIIHAVYLINCATQRSEMRKKSLASLTQALRIGDGIGAKASSSTPAPRKASPSSFDEARAKVIAAALEDPTGARC